MLDTAAEAVVSVRLVAIADLTPNPRNARTHPPEQIEQIAASMREFGFTNPILADVDDDGIIVAGHGRRLAALKLIEAGEPIRLPSGRFLPKGMVPVIDCTGWSESQRRAYTLADNRLAETSEWDDELLKLEIGFLKDEGFDLDLTGFDAKALEKLLADPAESAPDTVAARATLAERFGIPPFSVLNAREGWWQDRKRAWLALGIQSEVGRGNNLIERSFQERISSLVGGHYSNTVAFVDEQRAKGLNDEQIIAAAEKKFGKAKNGRRKAATFGQDIMRGEHVVGGTPGGLTFGGFNENLTVPASGTSIFDPVLCELAYRWFCPPCGTILDPFAGGSVRGIVASELDRQYVGCELRSEQVAANRDQAAKICGDPLPIWHIGDSREITAHAAGTEADFVFSCPPYLLLEVYSDDPNDLSTLDEAGFQDAYCEIIAQSCSLLKDNRFATFVIGEVRDKKGRLVNFYGKTVEAFERAGLKFYNDTILVTSVGSLPIRAGKQFEATRKLGRTHQYCLTFVKGDPKLAAEAVGPVEFGEIKEDAGDAEPKSSEWGEQL